MSILKTSKKKYVTKIEVGSVKGCPFCGVSPQHGLTMNNLSSKIYVQVRCPHCGLEIQEDCSIYDFTPMDEFISAYNKVIQKWNTRKGKTND